MWVYACCKVVLHQVSIVLFMFRIESLLWFENKLLCVSFSKSKWLLFYTDIWRVATKYEGLKGFPWCNASSEKLLCLGMYITVEEYNQRAPNSQRTKAFTYGGSLVWHTSCAPNDRVISPAATNAGLKPPLKNMLAAVHDKRRKQGQKNLHIVFRITQTYWMLMPLDTWDTITPYDQRLATGNLLLQPP